MFSNRVHSHLQGQTRTYPVQHYLSNGELLMFRRQFLISAAATIPSLAASQLALAQSWPTKPIKAIQPFGAGSALDVVARLVLEQLSRQLVQPIVVENRAGAGGTIGTAAVAKSEP